MLYYASSIQEIKTICDWVNERLPESEEFNYPYAVAVIDQETGDILAGAVYTNYGGGNVFLSGAIDKEGIGKVTRESLADMLAVGFREPLKCNRITALVSETNKQSQRFVTGLGFQLEGKLRDYLGEGTLTYLYGMTRSDFLGGKYGRKRRRRQAA